MTSMKCTYWEDQDMWVGYLEDYPDYRTQGHSLDDLKTHLRELFKDLNSGAIPGIRRIAELQLS